MNRATKLFITSCCILHLGALVFFQGRPTFMMSSQFAEPALPRLQSSIDRLHAWRTRNAGRFPLSLLNRYREGIALRQLYSLFAQGSIPSYSVYSVEAIGASDPEGRHPLPVWWSCPLSWKECIDGVRPRTASPSVMATEKLDKWPEESCRKELYPLLTRYARAQFLKSRGQEPAAVRIVRYTWPISPESPARPPQPARRITLWEAR